MRVACLTNHLKRHLLFHFPTRCVLFLPLKYTFRFESPSRDSGFAWAKTMRLGHPERRCFTDSPLVTFRTIKKDRETLVLPRFYLCQRISSRISLKPTCVPQAGSLRATPLFERQRTPRASEEAGSERFTTPGPHLFLVDGPIIRSR